MLAPGDVVIGLESSGIHSNGLTLARHVFFEQAGLSIDHVFPELGIPLGEELLRPTLIYVPEILDIIEQRPDRKGADQHHRRRIAEPAPRRREGRI